METKTEVNCGPTRRKSTTKCVKLCPKEERNASLKKVSVILQKAEHERTLEEQQTLNDYSELVADLKLRWQKRDEAKRRTEEIEEPVEILQEKCLTLAKAIAQAEHLVVYTGAGISTAARIPDYRGPNGIWTRLQQGKKIENHDLTLAEPTYTHMALSELYSRKLLKYVVSQNCDGLHLRSGLPRTALSELHGNMYIEVCKNCQPAREYWRLFDVTEYTARFFHKTMRRCYSCSHELVDTIVHFGERGTLQWPLNWSGACKNADKADTILCLGSSLKVLKRYPWLWQMNKPAKKRPNLYIVNLQWTPKDDCAVLKINGKCDLVMKMVMKYLNIEVPDYDREQDPIFAHATPLLESEMHTTTQPFLKDNEHGSSEEASEKECKNISKSSSEEVKSEIKTENEEIVEEPGSKISHTNLIKNSTDSKFSPDFEINGFDKVKDETHQPDSASSSLCENMLYEEQKDALDFSKHKTVNSRNDNCDTNTHSSVKASRLTLNNGSSSSNCTLSESLSLTKRKSQDCSDSINLQCKSTSIFSIDSILNKNDLNNSVKNEIDPKTEQKLESREAVNVNNIQTLMAYYDLANTVLQNQMLGYVASNIYPFQTSSLYPGLHSIINPTPFANYDFNSSISHNSPSNKNSLLVAELNSVKESSEHKALPCVFCNKIFNSATCLYYLPAEPKFIKELYRFSKIQNCNKLLVCICCDYTTDEDEEESDTNESKSKKKNSGKNANELNGDSKEEEVNSESVSENIDQTNIEHQKEGNKRIDGKVVKIQAGWFGKGYRKNRRVKKR